MSVFNVRRATSKRLRSMSAIALSNSTLSGCKVSLVIGFSYFFFRKQEVLSRLSTAASRIELRNIDLEKYMYHLKPDMPAPTLEPRPHRGQWQTGWRLPLWGRLCETPT